MLIHGSSPLIVPLPTYKIKPWKLQAAGTVFPPMPYVLLYVCVHISYINMRSIVDPCVTLRASDLPLLIRIFFLKSLSIDRYFFAVHVAVAGAFVVCIRFS